VERSRFGDRLSDDGEEFPAACLAIDLEVDPKEARLLSFAAVAGGGETLVVHRGGDAGGALDALEAAAGGFRHLAGHNILHFDLPHLVAHRPGLSRLGAGALDTLWLNPLAFPRNPYHHLVKHYQDGRLNAGHVNDPELDAQLVLELLREQIAALRALGKREPDALTAYHYLSCMGDARGGFDAFFRAIRGAERPGESAGRKAVLRLLEGRACGRRIEQTLQRLAEPQLGWPMAYTLSWISVAGGDSVMPPWVRLRFPEASAIVRFLRDTACGAPGCDWCAEHADPRKALQRWFGFPSFRPEPADERGRSLQERIVAGAMAGRSQLGVLPTGTGKSICYQIPALSKFDRTGALTVVISPLVALMADQIEGLRRHGVSAAVTVNGQMSLPERHDALERVRMGDAAILLIAPEQLRSPSVRAVLKQREVGFWVLDEAHCLSGWGHDFRPDYRYISRFIREYSAGETPAPLLCLTATAKPEVIGEIRDHFKERLGVRLELLDGGGRRANLSFEVRESSRGRKFAELADLIDRHLPPRERSGAIVYCATRRRAERVAGFLQAQEMAAERFHAGLEPEEKADIQERFRSGELRVIAATSAFGMGIDKPDVRLVVHFDIPASLESYLQEAGRAGRDRQPARCVLLFSGEDVERQFGLSARARLERHEISAVLKALRRLAARTGAQEEVVATPGEILREERDDAFARDSATDDTRVRTAIAWLEEAQLLSREENRVRVYPSALRVGTEAQAREILARAAISDARRGQLLKIARHLMNAPPEHGVSTDELMGVSGLSPSALVKALNDLESLGIASNETAVSVFLHVGVGNGSVQRFERASRLEGALVALLRETCPEADEGALLPLNLARTCQGLRDLGHAGVRPDVVEALLRGLAQDGRDQEGGRGNIRLRRLSRNTIGVRLQRDWEAVERTAEVRRNGAGALLRLLIDKVGKRRRGKDIRVETTLGELHACLAGDIALRAAVHDATRLLNRALLWLHEQSVVTLGKGLSIFRPALTVRLSPKGGNFLQKDFAPLAAHYAEQTLQTHVMAEYAQRGLQSVPEALRLAEDYFTLEQKRFLRRWMPGRDTALRRQATSDSWNRIVKALNNPAQERIVADEREQTNVLILAGPGSGKTRVLVHRIAYLVRIRRQDPRGILVLTYNRHAAGEIRERLRVLIDEEGAQVTVSTCHALAMRLLGVSFAGRAAQTHDFDGIIREAVHQLSGAGLPRAEAEARRQELIRGYRWILVDEYQDIGPEEYALIRAVAGRSLDDPEMKLSLFAVGDDDQNIYSFAGASVEFIRRFEQDYAARPGYLTENYRASRRLIEAANHVIAPARNRMKAGHDIRVNAARAAEPAGGVLEALDPVARGRVQILEVADETAQAVAALDDLCRLSQLDPEWRWAGAAIISRQWRQLQPVRSCAEARGIPVEIASEQSPPLWRLREMQDFIDRIRQRRETLLSLKDLVALHNTLPENRWSELIMQGLLELNHELAGKPAPGGDIIEWLAEWAREMRGLQKGLMLLSAHRAKGLEFDHVITLDGGWERRSEGEDADAPRRLFYVAMTRARKSLAACALGGRHPFLDTAANPDLLVRAPHVCPEARAEGARRYQGTGAGDVDLSFAGRLARGASELAAIGRLQVGDPLKLVRGNGRWLVRDAGGALVGRMARSYEPPAGCVFVSGHVAAMLRWRRSDSEECYRAMMQREEWDVVLPEFVFRQGEER